MLMTRARYPTSGSLGAIAAERHRRRGVVDAGTPGLPCFWLDRSGTTLATRKLCPRLVG